MGKDEFNNEVQHLRNELDGTSILVDGTTDVFPGFTNSSGFPASALSGLDLDEPLLDQLYQTTYRARVDLDPGEQVFIPPLMVLH